MIGRVTQQTVQRSTLTNLQTNLTAMSVLQDKLSGTKNITRPSDDPSGTVSAMALRSALRANEQHARNAADGEGWLTTADAAIGTSLDAIRRVRDLTVQGASTGVMNAQAREAMAVEIEGLRDDLLAQANATYLGRPVFAGTAVDVAVVRTPADPAVPGSVATYQHRGVAVVEVLRRVDATTKVRVDVDGTAAFGDGATSVFATLDRIAAELRKPAGGDVGPEIATLDGHRDALLREVAGLGARHVRVQTAASAALDTKTSLTSQLTSIEDTDLPKTIMELQMQEVAYQAALGAASRVLQPSLMDFLR